MEIYNVIFLFQFQHVYHGPKKLKNIAQNIHQNCSILSQGLKSIGLKQLNNYFFDTILVDTVNEAALGGFNALRALSTRNEEPSKASRPFDSGRDGFVLGEGSGTIILEEYEHAKKRGANIYCEVKGTGTSGDAYHLTAPEPNGIGLSLIHI